ncbi:MAG: hypothetical protein IPK93_03400 [Solirubrobacterales bacterium]|nr:hypothetical protein [Solirubrobacterales bacterium]
MFDNVPSDATGYVMAAYIFFLLMVVIYIGILGAKFQRISREISQLTDEVEAGKLGAAAPGEAPEPTREESSV